MDKNIIVPEHVAIILDGNGRWAKKRMLPRNMGHVQGSKNVEKMCRVSHKLGIKYLTVYAFSTENWKRPNAEVEALMVLLGTYLNDCIKNNKKNNMVVRFIGDTSVLSENLKEKINTLTEVSKDNTGLNLTVALNYGGRDEIVRSIKNIVTDVVNNKIDLEKIDEEYVSQNLDTKEIPDPDLLIRPGGEVRISNYLLWQLAYSEMYFTDVFWPDFNEKELVKAIEYYNTKERRFGDVK